MAATGGQSVGEKTSPGPAAYDTRETNKTMCSYSFRPRTPLETLASPKFVPGPGTYAPPESINAKGRYAVSSYSNSRATLISPARSRRFVPMKPGNPGPGAYEQPPAIKEDGSYFVSKFRGSFCRSFGHSTRKNIAVLTTVSNPGPGAYRIPSEFGHYESAKVVKTEE